MPALMSRAVVRQVADWFGERVETETGHRESASRLFMDFARWCDDGSESPVSIKSFGQSLLRLGIGKVISNGVQYLDVRLKPV